MNIGAKSCILILLGTGGAATIKKYAEEDNILERLMFSHDTMWERVVDPQDIVPIDFPDRVEVKDGTLGELAANDVSRLLDVGNKNQGWNAVFMVYKKTLKGISLDQLIQSCKKILDIDYKLTRIEYLSKRKILRKFCSYPVRVREKIGEQEVSKFSKWSNPKRSARLIKRLDDGNLSSYCSWFPNTYTVYGEITLDEIDYIKLCQPKYSLI